MIRNRICKTKQIVTTIKTVSELLYATLVSWDMNCRGAKMKYFNEFKKQHSFMFGSIQKDRNFWKK